jgi:DNA-binding response OmpR family regulator
MKDEETIEMGAVTGRLRALSQNMHLRILIVDDDELERILIADRLEARGFDVTRAANGEEALAILERACIPVLLVDWSMPVMNGIELTEQLRARGMDDSYIIMLTGRDTTIEFEEGYRAGVDDYLTKKIRDTELLARIHAGFSTYSLRRALKDARAQLAAVLDVKAA